MGQGDGTPGAEEIRHKVLKQKNLNGFQTNRSPDFL